MYKRVPPADNSVGQNFKLFTGVLSLTILVSLMAITSKSILVEFKRYSRSSIFFEREQEFT